MSNTTLFLFFNEYPILPIVVILASSSAFLPILFIIYIAQIAPLHSNCRWCYMAAPFQLPWYQSNELCRLSTTIFHFRFILCIWVLGASFVVNLGLVTLDLANETGYMPLTAFEPRKNHLRFFYLYLIIFRNSLHTISMVLDHGDFLILLWIAAINRANTVNRRSGTIPFFAICLEIADNHNIVDGNIQEIK